MKKLIFVAFTLLLAAFTAGASEDVIEIMPEDEVKKTKESGRTLYQFMNVSDVVFDFVHSYIKDNLQRDFNYCIKSIYNSEDAPLLQYVFALYEKNKQPEEAEYLLDVYALPAKGVQQVVLYHPSS